MENKAERRPIPGWEGLYSADSDGNIWSEARTVNFKDGRKQFYAERALKLSKHSEGYRQVRLKNKHRQVTYTAHRLVAAAFGLIAFNDRNDQVDHINRNRSDNTLDNLRRCSPSQNTAYGGKQVRKDNQSGFRGVHWCNSSKKWKSEIHVKKRKIYVGSFDCAIEAAHAYDSAAREHFSEFAFQNFPNEKEVA